MTAEREHPEWIGLSTELSISGTTLIELAGNIIGCQSSGDETRVPGHIYRQIARERIAKVMAALDRLDELAAEEDKRLFRAMKSARAEASP